MTHLSAWPAANATPLRPVAARRAPRPASRSAWFCQPSSSSLLLLLGARRSCPARGSRPGVSGGGGGGMSGRESVQIPDDRDFDHFRTECNSEAGWHLTYHRSGIAVWIQVLEAEKSLHKIKVRPAPPQPPPTCPGPPPPLFLGGVGETPSAGQQLQPDQVSGFSCTPGFRMGQVGHSKSLWGANWVGGLVKPPGSPPPLPRCPFWAWGLWGFLAATEVSFRGSLAAWKLVWSAGRSCDRKRKPARLPLGSLSLSLCAFVCLCICVRVLFWVFLAPQKPGWDFAAEGFFIYKRRSCLVFVWCPESKPKVSSLEGQFP